jgi:hypothetical protein
METEGVSSRGRCQSEGPRFVDCCQHARRVAVARRPRRNGGCAGISHCLVRGRSGQSSRWTRSSWCDGACAHSSVGWRPLHPCDERLRSPRSRWERARRYQGFEICAHLGYSRLGRTADAALPRERRRQRVPDPHRGDERWELELFRRPGWTRQAVDRPGPSQAHTLRRGGYIARSGREALANGHHTPGSGGAHCDAPCAVQLGPHLGLPSMAFFRPRCWQR